LADILKILPSESNPNLLVGFETSDDAGIFRISETQALVQTVDFFPPIVDDPYAFGQIAAANALSDIYAMGGRPLTALNIVGFPSSTMPIEILGKILLGGADKIREAGAVIVGGHSIKDKELKYGVAVTGIIDIDKIIKNSGAKAGDILYLTKPLGTGIITTAIKRNIATFDDIARVISSMTQLNNIGSELMVKYGANAATDITGFGFMGHAYEMANGSDVTLSINFDKIPVFPNVGRYSRMGTVPGGAISNREYLGDRIDLSSDLDKEEIDILSDPQTSGGLLIALPALSAPLFAKETESRGLKVWEIGRVLGKQDKSIIVSH
jgi:selenide, water dikinase